MPNQPNAAELHLALSLYQYHLQENPHYGLCRLRERYFARERGHEHRPDISVNIDLYIQVYTSVCNVLHETVCDTLWPDLLDPSSSVPLHVKEKTARRNFAVISIQRRAKFCQKRRIA